MSPGMNDPRNTGTLPKNNKGRDRGTRDRGSYPDNQNSTDPRSFMIPTQYPKNVSQSHSRKTLIEHLNAVEAAIQTSKRADYKNSNTRPTIHLVPSTFHEHYFETQLHSTPPTYERLSNIHRRTDSSVKMTPPLDSRAQSPPNLSMKPTNTDKMPDRGQVEGRLNQIREYIKVTSTMMDSLSQSTDPQHQAQHEKLGRMVEDLYDSEQKLTNLVENCQKYWRFNENADLENGGMNHEQELVKKIEESQSKLAQLQEHQAQLLGMQLTVRERLNEARQAQQLICANSDEDNEIVSENEARESDNVVNLGNVEQLERETEALRGKLQQLENKKRNMDLLVQELQHFELSERVSGTSESSRRSTTGADKAAELEAMKAQLKHLKFIMNDAVQNREADNEQNVPEPEHDDDLPNNDTEIHDIENDVNIDTNSYNDLDEVRPKLSSEPPTVQQIHAVTRELKEQQQLLQTARAELKRLKQAAINPTPSEISTPSTSMSTEKKQSNHTASFNDLHSMQNTRRRFEDFMRKDQSHVSCNNQNGVQDWGSRRSSTSHHSHVSTPANRWPPPTNIAPTHDHSVEEMTTADHLLEMASQPQIMNGVGGNFWDMPNLMNQQSQSTNVASAEYYKQLLLGSQALQLQMMSNTIQQCCQLVWNQQREMQSMKAAITQLQTQLRQFQSRTSNSNEVSEQHSNLGRAAAQQPLYSTLDPSNLPPSSSLPNLVTLPSTSPAPPSVVSIPAGCQQQQLNNQVPPGNRANNYWDNFRSYSRQNLLSGSSKTATDASASISAQAQSSSTNTTIGNSTQINKRNRRYDLEYLPSAPVIDAQYSVNLQQERDSSASTALQNNYVLSNEQQQNHQQQLQQAMNIVDSPANAENKIAFQENEPSLSLGKKMRSDVKQLLKTCLQVLESRQENESPLPLNDYVSNSSNSSDNESEAGLPKLNEATSNENDNIHVENHLPDCTEPSAAGQAYISSPLPEFLEHEFRDVHLHENNVNSLPRVSSTTLSNNDSAVEIDFTIPDNSNNQFSGSNEVNLALALDSANSSEIHVDEHIDRDREYVLLERDAMTKQQQQQ